MGKGLHWQQPSQPAEEEQTAELTFFSTLFNFVRGMIGGMHHQVSDVVTALLQKEYLYSKNVRKRRQSPELKGRTRLKGRED